MSPSTNHSAVPDPTEVKAELQRILASRAFWRAEGLSRLLRYIVEETLAGRSEGIKEYSLGVIVFDRGESFDPKVDTIVRVQARRLRTRLAEYYEKNGHTGTVHIELSKGTYVPLFRWLGTAAPLRPAETSSERQRPVLFARGAILGGLFLVLGLLILVVLASRRHAANRVPVFEAIAVLPFESLSTEADQQYLADGIAEALITKLGQASPLRVIARTSVNKYRGARMSVGEIARELKVDVVVEGTVTQLGDLLRVTANLIQVSPEKQIWAHSYERNLREIPILQNEIAAAITGQIHGKLAPRQRSRLATSRPVDREAQLAYWKTRYFLDGRRDAESARKSVEYGERSVQLDSGYAPAHAALARSYLMLSNVGGAFPGEVMTRARASALKAISLDDELAEPHVALGSILLAYDWDWEGAEREGRRAISLNPSDADAHLHMANYLAAVGRLEEALIEITRARELDPLSFYINRNVGRILYFARRYDEALTELRQAGDMQPNSPTVDTWIVKSSLKKGLADQAVSADLRVRAAYDHLHPSALDTLRTAWSEQGLRSYWRTVRDLVRQSSRDDAHRCYRLAEINVYLGDTEEALRCLEEAWRVRSGFMPWIKVDPSLDPLRPDPRFQALLRRMGLSN